MSRFGTTIYRFFRPSTKIEFFGPPVKTGVLFGFFCVKMKEAKEKQNPKIPKKQSVYGVQNLYKFLLIFLVFKPFFEDLYTVKKILTHEYKVVCKIFRDLINRLDQIVLNLRFTSTYKFNINNNCINLRSSKH
jgi:hypothetical protein